MTKINKTTVLMALVLSFIFRSTLICAGSDAISPEEQAVTKPGYYRNDYFGFSLLYPESWVAVPRPPHAFQKLGGDILVRDGVLKRDIVEADQSNTRNLLGITNPREQSNGWGPQIIIVVERIHEGAPFKTAEEYLTHTFSFFAGVNSPKTTVVTPAREVSLGGRQFHRAELRAEWPGVTVRQFYYAAIIKSFAFSIIVSSADKDQLAEADHVLKEIHFIVSK